VARTVLGPRRALVLIFAASVAAAYGKEPSAAECAPTGSVAVPPAQQGDVREFERHVKSAPFYKELTRRFGPPEGCKITLGDRSIGLSFTYRGDARLNAKMDSRIEFTEQSVQLSGVSAKSGVGLLRKAETAAFGAKGCGIAWNAPAETIAGERVGSREAVYRGDTCSCQARVIYEGTSVVGLVLRSAC
jgi:hypothetical protein